MISPLLVAIVFCLFFSALPKANLIALALELAIFQVLYSRSFPW